MREQNIEVEQDHREQTIGINSEQGERTISAGSERSVLHGIDGVSPIATVTQTETGATISITDRDATTTAEILNGAQGLQGQKGEKGDPGTNGTNGEDGFSPTATVTKSGDTATIRITDKNGTTTAQIKDGTGATITVDSAMSSTSTNPVQNKVISSALNAKANPSDIPTKTSDLTNDSGYITSYTETDPIFSASPASGITSANISAWNGKSDFSGNYNDLTNKPTIPTVNNATLTIQKNGTNVQTFTANQSGNATANITVPTKTSDLTNDSSFVTSSGTVAKANQLTTSRTIAISGGVTGTATSFSGASNISIPVTKMYETYLGWGNQNLSGMVSPIDTAMSEEFSANRLAYMPASTITVEYSRDSGSTWTAYSLTDAQKVALVTTTQVVFTGGTSSLASSTCQLRVTIAPNTQPYMETRKLFLNISTSGVAGAQVLVERSGMGATTFSTVTTAALSGWSGWNSIPINITFGGTASWSNRAIRLTFSYTGKSDGYPNAQLCLNKIRLYGETAWSTPSNLANNGHLYAYDTSQNVTFPANVKVTGSLQHGNYTYTLPNKTGTVAMTSDIPTIPTVNDATLTIQKNGTNVQTFTANATSNKTANIIVPTKTSDLTNDSNFVSNTDYATATTGGVVKVGGGLEITNGVLSATGGGIADAVEWNNVLNKPTFSTVATSGSYNDLTNKPTIPTVNNATLTIQRNNTSVGTFTANASSNKTINITVPTTAADVSALPASTKYGASITVSLNTTDYKMTTTLKDQDGNTLGTAQTIDLPLESVVVNGSYDNANKKIVLTLQNGNTVDIPVGDLVAGLQTEITSTNKLSSDLVDDTNHTQKFVTAAQITKLNGIATGAEVNVQSDWATSDATFDSYIKNKPTIGNGKITIKKNGTQLTVFTANQTADVVADVIVPTKTSDLTNNSNFVADASYVHTDNNFTATYKNRINTLTDSYIISLISDGTEVRY